MSNVNIHADGKTTSGDSGPFFHIALVVFAAIIAMGIFAWITQLREGLGVTGLTTTYARWGLYIQNFVFLIGVSAGGIIVACLANLLGLERFRPVARIAEIVALTCLLLAGASVVVDLGRPDRMWLLLLHGQFMSPLLWDVIVVTSYIALTMALTYFATRADLARISTTRPRLAWLYRVLTLGRMDVSSKSIARDRKALKVLSAIALPGAVVLHSVTAWILGLVKANPSWFSTLLAPLFIASAIVSGVALVTVVALLAKGLLGIPIPQRTVEDLAKVLIFTVPILGYFLFAELLTVLYGGVPAETVFFRDMFAGRYAWIFWFNLMGGLALPFAILLVPRARRSGPTVLVACILLVMGVYAERFNIVVIPQLRRLLLHPIGSYTPTWIEIWITLALVATISLAIMVLSRLVPLAEE